MHKDFLLSPDSAVRNAIIFSGNPDSGAARAPMFGDVPLAPQTNKLVTYHWSTCGSHHDPPVSLAELMPSERGISVVCVVDSSSRRENSLPG